MPKSEKLVYIVSDIGKALAFEWLAGRLKKRFDLTFILIGNSGSELQRFLEVNDVRCFVVSDVQFTANLRRWLRIVSILAEIRPDIVHTHLWRANLLGLTAAWVLRIKKRLYTRHHAMLHYVEYPSGRKWDLLCNFLATDVIAISRNVQKILVEKDKISPGKVHLVHHGFDFAYFDNINPDRVAALRARYGLEGNKKPVVGVIARYLELKGIQYIIPAFQKLLLSYPNAQLVLANTRGDYAAEIKKLLEILPAGSFVEVPYENDLAALFCLFDVYVHVPIDMMSEAFGQTYIEALRIGIPSIFTLSGIASEFVVDELNALVVPYRDPLAIYAGLIRVLTEPALRERLVKSGKSSTSSFSIDKMTNLLVDIYEQ